MELVIIVLVIGAAVWYIKSKKKVKVSKSNPENREPTQEDLDEAERGSEPK